MDYTLLFDKEMIKTPLEFIIEKVDTCFKSEKRIIFFPGKYDSPIVDEICKKYDIPRDSRFTLSCYQQSGIWIINLRKSKQVTHTVIISNIDLIEDQNKITLKKGEAICLKPFNEQFVFTVSPGTIIYMFDFSVA